MISDLDCAIQEFEDEAYHHSAHPAISDKAKAIALAAMLEKQSLLRAGLNRELLLEISRAAGYIHDDLVCPFCGDGLDLELVDGELAIGCFSCENYIPLTKLVKIYLKQISENPRRGDS